MIAAAAMTSSCGAPRRPSPDLLRNPAPAPVVLRVMTYNIAAGGGDLQRTAETIAQSRPDLVGLQEVDRHWHARSQFADQATRLGQQLQMAVCFSHIYDLPGAETAAPRRQYGVALLSRFPITRCTNQPLTRASTQAPASAPQPMPGLLDARVEISGVPIRILNTHLDYRPDPAVRRQQVAEMLSYMDGASRPTILLGDLNATPDAPELVPLFQVLHDAWSPARGSGLTYPATAPTKRIDYVLLSAHFRVTESAVVKGGVSDHRAVVTELVVERPS